MRARSVVTVSAVAALSVGLLAPAVAAAEVGSGAPVEVIVRELPGAGDGPARAVEAAGGTVGATLGIIDGFEATVPADRIDALRSTPGIHSVTEDAALTLDSTEVADTAGQSGSLHTIANEVTGASAMWDAGYTGAGVDVAVIDSGVVPVEGLDDASRVIHGPDLSFEAGTHLEDLDTYGHGTHMAGIIGGRDSTATGSYTGDSSNFVGMAPDARIVSIKVADALGRTDVSQAIAAIDWVVQHGDEDGLDIRVLNMSFGTDGVQSYLLDPLAHAAEQAWHAGVVVVVAVGNEGFGTGKVNNPAYDPYVIAVGSNDSKGTATTEDDVVSAFSNDGDGTRNPDVVAPGDKVVSLRSAGSYLDAKAPAARIGERLFRGSGTSQAAAVVSGAAALLVQQRPDITPDQVKALLMGTARDLPNATARAQGSGLIDLAAAKDAPTPDAVQSHPRSTGQGSLEASRGSVHVEVEGEVVTGEVDVTGTHIDASTAETIADGVEDANAEDPALSGMSWSGMSWSGMSWSGMSWSGMSWSGMSWSGMSWSGMSWSGMSWSGMSWSGMSWSGADWA
jgi:serine protease AprX